MAIVLLMILPRGTKNQNQEITNPALTFEAEQARFSVGENFLEKIGVSADSDITSTIKRRNPLDIFESLRQLALDNEINIDSKPVSPAPKNPKLPKIISVLPERVRAGDSVTITGENFTPTNNNVTLGDGPVRVISANLVSIDGKTITFTYQPPVIKAMTEEEIRALPVDIVNQIEMPIKAAGTTLTKALDANNEVRSETQVRDILQKNGYPPDAMYHYFHITVENSQGSGISKTALLYGLRNTIQDGLADNVSLSLLGKFLKSIGDFTDGLIPIAYAQMGQQGGGFTTGMIMICTCNGNVLTFQLDYSGSGSGLYVFSPGFIPTTGSGRIAGFWLGGYQMMGGSCTIYAGVTCVTIMGNIPVKPVGYSN